MKQTKKMKRLLEKMAQVERMERGKLCRMGDRPHYNHQTWEKGKNVVRYVPARETEFLQEAIDGYRAFLELAEHYVDEVIQQTRRERAKTFPKPAAEKTPRKPKSRKNKKIDS